MRLVMLALVLAASIASGGLAAAPVRGFATAQQGAPAPNKHVWVNQTRKEWVPPEKKVVQVGVDAKGNPIYETQIVKPGYWKSVTCFACACGATKS